MGAINVVPEAQLLGIGLATGAATYLGGSLALRAGHLLDLLLDFSFGTIIGVALFDLIPEALNLAGQNARGLIAAAGISGFVFYIAIDRGSLILVSPRVRRHFAPATLVLHSLLDGLGIGFAFQLSWAAGLIVVIGVLAHDLIDGANTVAVALAAGARSSTARRWLIADTLAPLAGILLAATIAVRALPLALILGAFGGSFLYLGARILLSDRQAHHPLLSRTAVTAFGLSFIYIVVRTTLRA